MTDDGLVRSKSVHRSLWPMCEINLASFGIIAVYWPAKLQANFSQLTSYFSRLVWSLGGPTIFIPLCTVTRTTLFVSRLVRCFLSFTVKRTSVYVDCRPRGQTPGAVRCRLIRVADSLPKKVRLGFIQIHNQNPQQICSGLGPVVRWAPAFI